MKVSRHAAQNEDVFHRTSNLIKFFFSTFFALQVYALVNKRSPQNKKKNIFEIIRLRSDEAKIRAIWLGEHRVQRRLPR